jgi:hypothetical protein
VEKRYDRLAWPFLGQRHEPFSRERRVGMLLRRQPPPVPVASLVAADRRRLTLRFEAVDGVPIGPKFPEQAAHRDVDDLVAIAARLRGYRPKADFLRRFDLSRRLQGAVAQQCLVAHVADAFRRQAANDPPVLVFAHGDITARNVLRSTTGEAVLIDWEWAGWYPRGWDMAFLWFSLVDVPGGREAVEDAVPQADLAWFWRSALLVQVLHLMLWGLRPGTQYRPKHERMRDELIERVMSLG